MRRAKLAIAVLVGLSGCGSTASPTQKEAAHKQWDDARASVLCGLANDQFRNGNLDKCEETLGQALRVEPTNPALHRLAAKLAIEQGKADVAEAHLAEARRLAPADAEADYLTGVLRQRYQRPAEALACYRTAAGKDPGELSYVLGQADMLVQLRRQPEALRLLQSQEKAFPNSPAVRDEEGQLLGGAGRWGEAAAAFRDAAVLSGDDAGVRERLGFALFYAGQYAEAGDALGRLAKGEGYAGRADVFAALGRCEQADGRWREARDSFEQATRIDGGTAGYWLDLGRASAQLDDLPRAELAARKAASVDGTSAEAQCLLGYVRLKQKQLPAALAAFTAAASLDPADAVGPCMCGYVLAKQGRAAESAAAFERARRIDPADAVVRALMRGPDRHDEGAGGATR